MTHSFWVETLTILKTAQSELTFLQQQVQLVDGRTPKSVWCASEAVLVIHWVRSNPLLSTVLRHLSDFNVSY